MQVWEICFIWRWLTLHAGWKMILIKAWKSIPLTIYTQKQIWLYLVYTISLYKLILHMSCTFHNIFHMSYTFHNILNMSCALIFHMSCTFHNKYSTFILYYILHMHLYFIFHPTQSQYPFENTQKIPLHAVQRCWLSW